VKLLIYGSSGTSGRAIVEEALTRGHHATLAFREAGRTSAIPGVAAVTSDVTDPAAVAAAAAGHDAVVSALSPRTRQPADVEILVQAAHGLVAGLRLTPGVRLLVAGGSGGLQVAPGVLLLKTFKGLTEEELAVPLAHERALAVYRAAGGVEWTVISPGGAGWFLPSGRTGRYRRGGEQVLTDAHGRPSGVSVQDYAVAFLDELEEPKARRERIHVAY
jgi:putative NADH-flavin reductase